jgi:hypothetical protein
MVVVVAVIMIVEVVLWLCVAFKPLTETFIELPKHAAGPFHPSLHYLPYLRTRTPLSFAYDSPVVLALWPRSSTFYSAKVNANFFPPHPMPSLHLPAIARIMLVFFHAELVAQF